MWADTYWNLSHSKTHLEQMMRDLIVKAKRWDLEPTPGSQWWTCTCADEMMDDIEIRTSTGLHKLPIEKKFKILGQTKLGGEM